MLDSLCSAFGHVGDAIVRAHKVNTFNQPPGNMYGQASSSAPLPITGYGVVFFYTAHAAKLAMEALHGCTIGGVKFNCTTSARSTSTNSPTRRSTSSPYQLSQPLQPTLPQPSFAPQYYPPQVSNPSYVEESVGFHYSSESGNSPHLQKGYQPHRLQGSPQLKDAQYLRRPSEDIQTAEFSPEQLYHNMRQQQAPALSTLSSSNTPISSFPSTYPLMSNRRQHQHQTHQPQLQSQSQFAHSTRSFLTKADSSPNISALENMGNPMPPPVAHHQTMYQYQRTPSSISGSHSLSNSSLISATQSMSLSSHDLQSSNSFSSTSTTLSRREIAPLTMSSSSSFYAVPSQSATPLTGHSTVSQHPQHSSFLPSQPLDTAVDGADSKQLRISPRHTSFVMHLLADSYDKDENPQSVAAAGERSLTAIPPTPLVRNLSSSSLSGLQAVDPVVSISNGADFESLFDPVRKIPN